MWLIVPTLLGVHVLICLLLVLVVLMQLPRSEGLGAAFGGSVMSDALGTGVSSFLSRSTVWLGISFFVVTLLLAIAYAHEGTGNSAEKAKLLAPVPAAATSATPAASPVAAPAVAPVAAPSASPEASVAPSATPAVAPSASPVASPDAAAAH